MHPRLMHFRISHYNEKIRWALDYKKWPHIREAQTPGLHIPRVRFRTGQQQLPAIEIDGKWICGSNHILEEIERRRPDPPLFPKDKERALAIQKFFDEEVAPDLRRLFWSTYLDSTSDVVRMATMGTSGVTRGFFRVFFPIMRPIFRRNLGASKEQVAAAHERLPKYLDRLESEIGKSGYLVGDSFGVADICAASIMSALVRPPQFSYPIPKPYPAGLVELQERYGKHPAYQWVERIYAEHRGESCEVAPLARA